MIVSPDIAANIYEFSQQSTCTATHSWGKQKSVLVWLNGAHLYCPAAAALKIYLLVSLLLLSAVRVKGIVFSTSASICSVPCNCIQVSNCFQYNQLHSCEVLSKLSACSRRWDAGISLVGRCSIVQLLQKIQTTCTRKYNGSIQHLSWLQTSG